MVVQAFSGRVPSFLCHPEEWHLKGMNWTDGGEDAPGLPMCLPPGDHMGHGKHLDDCPGAVAAPKVC
jgi:hypothetical protein